MEHAMDDVSWMTHGKGTETPYLSQHMSLSTSSIRPPTADCENLQSWQSSTYTLTDRVVQIEKPAGYHKTQLPSPPPRDVPRAVQSTDSPIPSKVNGNTALPATPPATAPTTASSLPAAATAKSIPQRPGRARSQSGESSPGVNGTPPQRRGSWFSSLSSKFGSPGNQPASPAPTNPPTPSDNNDDDDVTPLPKITANKNAVLPHASRQTGDAPYVPAPPKSAQPGFLGVLRRLSSSNAATMQGSKVNHGLVDRKVLNVDRNRERCRVNELTQSKLRRVAFCVDVEIAPQPRYLDEEDSAKKPADKAQKRKVTEKSEGLALKDPAVVTQQKEKDGVVKETGGTVPKEPVKEGTEATNGKVQGNGAKAADAPKPEKETTRKKEKKKKSEAERKAKKEQKRKEALEKGAIPMEIHLDSDSSTEDLTAESGTPKAQFTPTTNPGRIYRRCCQLRETDILTKITLQLPKTTDSCRDGIVEKLELHDYFLSLPDLATLGDFLAVVPVKEVILENCGLTDEGVRMVLAGLLAARRPSARLRKPVTRPADLTPSGGVIERLVLKNNKIGNEGWKHICLFIHMCRSIKSLDLSSLPFPAATEQPKTPLNHHFHHHHHHQHAGNSPLSSMDMAALLSKSIGDRLAGSELELLNMGATGLTTNQLGVIIDGVTKSGVCRLGLSHNNLDPKGVQHVASYLSNTKCEGIDLSGNDLRDHLGVIADAMDENDELWALSLADCNLKPGSLCKLFAKLVKLPNFRFLDLSHNHDLFGTDPDALSVLRRYLPQMENLKRLHLSDVSMASEQAIALADILPETLAHINLLDNPILSALADAKTEETQEEACALYASLLAAARVSKALVKVDIENPSANSGEVIKALANRMLAFCMRNLQGVPDIRDSTSGEPGPQIDKFPDVLRHLVGYEEDFPSEDANDTDEPAPDEDYVIGGTGVVKALACVLKNRGDDSSRRSGEFTRDIENGTVPPRAHLPSGKAKDMSKALLASARKIRLRLQPALTQAKANPGKDFHNYHRLLFLDHTIEGIIKRFEDEFPETRQPATPGMAAPDRTPPAVPELATSLSSLDAEAVLLSDAEDVETEVRSPSRSRSNSIMSHSSKALVEAEGQTLRRGYSFRRAFVNEHYDLFNHFEEIGSDPTNERMIASLMEELAEDDEQMRKSIEEKGAMATFREHKDEVWRRMREKDPQHWARFIESQEKARANVKPEATATLATSPTKIDTPQSTVVDEQAIDD
ncbi:RNI-like protein [Xylariomycetidae sp. FL2044]|nr:RNI-like protein [Xylariomycetidae sp. FL2044]